MRTITKSSSSIRYHTDPGWHTETGTFTADSEDPKNPGETDINIIFFCNASEDEDSPFTFGFDSFYITIVETDSDSED